PDTHNKKFEFPWHTTQHVDCHCWYLSRVGVKQVFMRKCLVTCFAVAVFLLVTLPLGAQTSKADADRIAKLEQQIADAKSSADNSWMLTSSALVLMMTGPGLALFYGGLVRKKNVLATMMQSFAMMALITVLWALFGYSLSFGAGNGFVGDFHHLFLNGVGSQPDPDYSTTIPQQTFMVYQLMFAIITPARITWADVSAIHAKRCRLIASCSASSELASSGWVGSALMREVRWLLAISRPARLWLRTSRPQPQLSGGRALSGCATVSPARSGPSPVRSRAWSPSHRQQVS